jgi:hypothetical protein
MDRQDDEKETTQAWFVVTDPGDNEHFAAIDGSESPEMIGAGMQPQAAAPEVARCKGEESENSPEVPKTEVELGRSLLSKEESPTGLVLVQFEEPIEPTDTSPQSEKSDANRVLGVEAELIESSPAPIKVPDDDMLPVVLMDDLGGPAGPERIEAAAGTESPIHSISLAQAKASSSRFGFTQSELIRIGSKRPSAPSGVVGLVVTARTPRRVRLGQITVLQSARTVIGRGRTNLLVDDPEVANLHAVITFECGEQSTGFRLYTHNSAPVTVNGASVGELVQLTNGDRIAIGSTELVFLAVPLCPGGAE